MGQKLDQLMARAGRLPGFRQGAVGDPVVAKAEGARIYDVENRGFIDYTGGWGAAILGYGNQFVLDAVRKVLATGVPDGLHHPLEVELAEALERYVAWARTFLFFRTADEALRAAVAWAKKGTGRERILLLDGGGRKGLDHEKVREVPAWDGVRIEAAITAGASKVAAFVVDPLLTGVGLVPPPEGLLAHVGEVCRKQGVPLILDERVAGFRLGRGGAAEWAGVEPDVAVYGGALGGGFPIGVLAFKEPFNDLELLIHADPPHPASLAAADAVLSVLKNDAVYERLAERAEQLVTGIRSLGERFARPVVVNAVGSVLGLYFAREPVADVGSFEAADGEQYRRVREALLEEGVVFPPYGRQPVFLSHAHSAKDVDETLAALERVFVRLHQEDMP